MDGRLAFTDGPWHNLDFQVALHTRHKTNLMWISHMMTQNNDVLWWHSAKMAVWCSMTLLTSLNQQLMLDTEEVQQPYYTQRTSIFAALVRRKKGSYTWCTHRSVCSAAPQKQMSNQPFMWQKAGGFKNGDMVKRIRSSANQSLG